MPVTVPVDKCHSVTMTPLPNKDVTTYDNQSIQYLDILYFRFGTGPSASEYTVLSHSAIKEPGSYKVAVVGPAGVPGWLSVKDLVKDKAEWWAFYQKRYAATPPKEEQKEDVERKPTRKRKPST